MRQVVGTVVGCKGSETLLYILGRLPVGIERLEAGGQALGAPFQAAFVIRLQPAEISIHRNVSPVFSVEYTHSGTRGIFITHCGFYSVTTNTRRSAAGAAS